MLFWLKCWHLRLIIICSLADYAIDMSLPWDLDVICFCVCLWSCWNSAYELDIVATTRSNRVRQSFSFVSFSLSTELLEDKQGFKLGGVDTSPSYLLFQTLLPLFWTLICMIWMELTWTDAVFSRIALVLFLCRNQSSPNVLKIMGSSFGKYHKYLRQVPPQGVGQWATSPCSATTPWWRWAGLWGPHAPAAPNSNSISCLSSQKKIRGEVFIAFLIRRRHHYLFFIWGADLESVLGSGEGKSSPSSSSTFFPLQFHEALHCSWVIYS